MLKLNRNLLPVLNMNLLALADLKTCKIDLYNLLNKEIIRINERSYVSFESILNIQYKTKNRFYYKLELLKNSIIIYKKIKGCDSKK